jgi:chemotaxis protein CheX
MKVLHAEIEDIVETIWSTLVAVPLRPSDHAVRQDESTVTGIVHIDGAWHGAVFVRCPLALASLVTAAMFQGDEAPHLDEVCDALGELTNMVAGNVKALLPQPSALSLPTVAFGSDYEIAVVGTRPIASVSFTSETYPLVVSVSQRIDDADRALP